MSHKREDILFNAAEALRDFGDTVTRGPERWTLSTVSPVLLRNVGEDDAARELESIGITRDTAVIVHATATEDRVFKVGDPVTVGLAFDTIVGA